MILDVNEEMNALNVSFSFRALVVFEGMFVSIKYRTFNF